MQQEWDDLDRLIASSFDDIDAKEDYNVKLLNKTNKNSQRYTVSNYTPALSFIAAGVLLIITYASNLQYNIYNLEFWMRSYALSLGYNFNSIMKIFERVI
ncbi:hypothetical protein SAMN05443428_109105 [Caloramator quimbayensis]|uniref:Uncharacterized protein n=1 Tax=Caloramator quimbayensis TaxID=1147123 RepID=A0A1T4XI98_9CLOT|nr:hypothetical protein [Caloramator quimbayensis]SKA89289.1 hypothetical protein SAMN05443428_109105 [Caloramator quimbayensis]